MMWWNHGGWGAGDWLAMSFMMVLLGHFSSHWSCGWYTVPAILSRRSVGRFSLIARISG